MQLTDDIRQTRTDCDVSASRDAAVSYGLMTVASCHTHTYNSHRPSVCQCQV